MMNADSVSQFLLALGRISARAGVLVLVVLALRWLLGDRLTPRWRCALWLLVAGRLLLPVSFGTAVSLFNLLPHWQPHVESPPVAVAPDAASPTHSALRASDSAFDPGSSRRESAHPEESAIRNGQTGSDRSEMEMSGLTSAATRVAGPASAANHSRSDDIPVGPVAPQRAPTAIILFAIWLLGAIALGAWLAISSWRNHRRFRQSCERRAADPALLSGGRLDARPALEALLDACRAQLGVHTRLTVVECDGLSSPALYGLFRPRLLLPRGFAQKFSPEELRFVFLHELAHLKRRDLLVNWLVALLQIAHWFNPLLWLGFACWRADRELACDALVLETAGAERSRDYGRTILRLLEGFTHRAAAPGLVGILEDKRRLRQRIAMIARFVPTRRWSPLAILLVLALAVVGLTDAQRPKATNETAEQSSAEFAGVRWGEPVNGLSMRAVATAGTEFRMGQSLPIKVQLKNVADAPLPIEALVRSTQMVATDMAGKWLPLRSRAGVGIWKVRTKRLASGETIEWVELVETMRFRDPRDFPKDVNLSFSVAGSTPPIKVRFEDIPTNNLSPRDLPDKWQSALTLAYTDERGIWGGSRYLQVDLDGAARLILGRIGRPANQLLPGVVGTFSTRLSTAQLDRLVGLLRTNRVWELARIPTAEMPAADYPTLVFNIAFRGKSVVMHNGDPAEPHMKAFREAMDRFMIEIVETARKSGTAQSAPSAPQAPASATEQAKPTSAFSGQLAPTTEPLKWELVGVLFERISRKEKIEFELLCQALVGPQTALRADAATLLGDSGDKRAIPFLIDALSDESVHDGAHYVDPGDATTRHRADKALKKLTAQDSGFVWSDPKEKRQEAIQRWIDWYRKSIGDGAANESQPIRSTNALRSRIVFERTVFKQGEPIEGKVLVKNVSDQPVRYDAQDVGPKGSWTLFSVKDSRGEFPPYIGMTAQWNVRPWEEYLTLAPGEEIEVETVLLSDHYYLGKAQRYEVHWSGTRVRPLWRRVNFTALRASLLAQLDRAETNLIALTNGNLLPREEEAKRYPDQFRTLRAEWLAEQKEIADSRRTITSASNEQLETERARVNSLTMRVSGLGSLLNVMRNDLYVPVLNTSVAARPRQREQDRSAYEQALKEFEQRPQRDTQSVPVGLPPAGPVAVEVVPTPNGGPDGDLVGRVLDLLPPGWRINGAKVLAESIAPQGRQSGRGSRLQLVHHALPGYIPNSAFMELCVMADASAETNGTGKQPATYVGKSRLGYLYLSVTPASLARWNYAAKDIAAALEVTEPPPKEVTGPDWGRLVSRILAACANEGTTNNSLSGVCSRSEISTGENGKPLILYDSKAAREDYTWTPVQSNRLYYASLSVRPITPSSATSATESDQRIQWDGTSSSRAHRVKRLGVDIVIEVRSDEPEFVKRLNAILDREISATLASAASTVDPAEREPRPLPRSQQAGAFPESLIAQVRDQMAKNAGDTNGIQFATAIVPDRSEISLGEPLCVTLFLTNTSDKTIYVNEAAAVQFRATDALGQVAPPPEPGTRSERMHAMIRIGFVGREVAVPGGVRSQQLYLPRWVNFTDSGDYTVQGSGLIRAYPGRSVMPSLTCSFTNGFRLRVLPRDAERLGARIQELSTQLNTTNEPTLASVVLQLADIEDARVVPHLVGVIEKAKTGQSAAYGLVQMRGGDVIQWAKTEQSAAMIYALEGLARYPGPESFAAIAQAMEYTADSGVRAKAAEAMGNMKSEGAVKALNRALKDESEMVRRAAAEALTTSATVEWGKPFDGMSVRLQANKPVWGKAEVPAFTLEARHDGTRPCLTTWDQRFGELEVDGRRYSWLPFGRRPSAQDRFVPGAQALKCVVTMNSHWLAADDQTPLRILPGKHTVRYVHFWQFYRRGESERLVSNPVEIEVRADVQATEPVWGEPGEGIALQLRADKTSWDTMEIPLVTLSARNQGEQRSRFTLRRLLHKELEVDGVFYSWNETNAPFLYNRLEDESAAILLSREWRTGQGAPLDLSPGEHTVQFKVVLPAFPPSSSTAEPVPVSSNPVRIRVASSSPDFALHGGTSTNLALTTTNSEAARQAFTLEQQMRSSKRPLAIGETITAADESFPARVPQSQAATVRNEFPIPSGVGDWSEWSNGLRGRLLVAVPPMQTNRPAGLGSFVNRNLRHGIVYLELQNSGFDREVYYVVRSSWEPSGRDSLRGELRDDAGNVLEAVSRRLYEKGMGPGPRWLLLVNDSTSRFKVSLGLSVFPPGADWLNLELGFDEGNTWSIPKNMTNDCYLSATLTVIPPMDGQTPSGAPAWSGTLKLPPVKVPKWE